MLAYHLSIALSPIVLSLHPLLFALLVIGALFAWIGLGYLGLRMWVLVIDAEYTGTSLCYLTLALGPVSLTAIIGVIAVAFVYVLVVELFWNNMVLQALKRFHTHVKNLR